MARHAYCWVTMSNENTELSSETLGSLGTATNATEMKSGGEIPARINGFSVSLKNFDGPFDLLLQLISRHKMDITEVAIATVTDEFIAYIKALEATEEGWKLDHATEFLVVAATLLDLTRPGSCLRVRLMTRRSRPT